MAYDFEPEIREILDSYNFDKEDFSIVLRGIEPKEIIIEYIYSNNNYIFTFQIPNKKEKVRPEDILGKQYSMLKEKIWTYIFRGSMKPGQYAPIEKFEHDNFTDVKKEIKLWQRYLYQELKQSMIDSSSSIEIDLDANNEDLYITQIENIEKQIDGNITDKEMFTKEEKEELNKKLDEIKNKFDEELKNLKLEDDNLRAELDKINEDFLKLKDSLDLMSKKNWCKKFLRKTKDFLRDSNKRIIMIKTVKLVNGLLKMQNIEVPMLKEGIETIEQILE
ncbi:hypothetical protein [Clostridium botulinum]|uniref:hypothetical protein n=1 Tax=Clostridium botulinum TaxID=1491 RepID=UPI003DA23BE3